MARIARKDIDTPFLHLMVQGINKEYVFYKKEYIEEYLKIFEENEKKYKFSIIAYCIMNNHAHFLVYAEDIGLLGQAMHRINFLYAQMFNKKEKRVGTVFRNRYKLEPIYNIKYLMNCIKYIHNNPVKAKIANSCEEYIYSSYRDYINNNGVTQSKIIKEIFGEKCNYLELFDNSFDKKFMDIESENKEETDYYIISGICEFKRNTHEYIWEIFEKREILKKLICFLKEEWGISYEKIKEFFGVSNGTMQALKKLD